MNHQEEEEQLDNIIVRTIYLIAGGFTNGGTTKLARKKYLKEVQSTSCQGSQHKQKGSSFPKIKFMAFDISEVFAIHNNPMVISAIMVNAKMKRVFINQGNSANIIFQEAFNKLGLWNANLQMNSEELVGFMGEENTPRQIHYLVPNPRNQTTIKNCQGRFPRGGLPLDL